MALIHCDFHSEVLGLCCSMNVILPQASAQELKKKSAQARRHPTLWLLHGMSDDHTIWQRRTSLERYVEGLDLAVVMPFGHRSFYADMAHGFNFETFMAEELPAIARSLFPLSDQRQNNFVAGLSMGGYGAFRLGLHHPQNYSHAASLSGALDIRSLVARPDRKESPEMMNIFGDLKKVPGSPHDLMAEAARALKKKTRLPALYACCGTEDFLYQDNLNFVAHAKKIGLKLTYEEGPGMHNWEYWDMMIQKVLTWLPVRRMQN